LDYGNIIKNKVFFFFQFTPNPSWKKKNGKNKFSNNKKNLSAKK